MLKEGINSVTAECRGIRNHLWKCLDPLLVQEHVICRGEPMCSPGIGSSICKGMYPLGVSGPPGRHTGLPLQKLHESATLKL